MGGMLVVLFCGVISSTAVITHAGGENPVGPAPATMVRVFNYAAVTLPTLSAMLTDIRAIFEHAGLPVNWVICGRAPEHPSNPQACEEPREPTDLMLRILPGSGVVLDNNALGQATVTSEGGFNADLFFKRIDNLSQMGISKSRLLAYAAAHEVCHLLLGSGSHSPTGIMRARWDRRDLEAINRAWLSFSPNECEQMRASVRLGQGYNDQYAVGDQAVAQSRTGRLEPIAIAAQVLP
jgi:hypothetical protein